MNLPRRTLIAEFVAGSKTEWQAAILLAACFFAPSAHAVTITPDNPVPPYCLVRVQAVPGSTVWILGIQAGVLVNVDSQGSTEGLVVFTGPPGTYAVLCIEQGVNFQKIVNISGSIPPGPPPIPPPNPPPIPPPPTDDVSKTVAEMVTRLIPVVNRTKCAELATAYRNIASRIGVDLFTSSAIREATRAESSKILAGQEDKWTPLYNELAKYLYDWQTKEQRDRVEYQTMWNNIAAGFDLAPKGNTDGRK